MKNYAILIMASLIFIHYFYTNLFKDNTAYLAQQTVLEQLEGKLSETARQIATMNEELKLGNAQLVSQNQLNRLSDDLLKEHKDLKEFMAQTNSELKSYSSRLTSISVQVKEMGKKATIPLNNDKPSFYSKCLSDPASCEPLPISWDSEHKVGDKSILSFNTPNLWTDGFNYDLNLAYNVEVFTFGEDCNTGAMGNQGVYIKAGYFDKDGKFVVLAQDKLMKGEKGLDPKFILAPTCQIIARPTVRFIEASYFGGVSLNPKDTSIGAFGGINLVNILQEGNLKLGFLANYNKQVGLGVSVQYYPFLWGKPLNVAPTFGIVWNKQGNQSFLVGLSFKFW